MAGSGTTYYDTTGRDTIQAMPTPHVTQAILDTIRDAGFHIGETVVLSLDDGHPCQVANAVDAKTGESFTVMAPTRYEAAVELAEQVGFDLEDG